MAKVTASSRIERLIEMNRADELGGGKQRQDRQKADGKLTAREQSPFFSTGIHSKKSTNS